MENTNYDEFENATEEERNEALKAMGLSIKFKYIARRTDSKEFNMGTHFEVTLFRNGKKVSTCEYSKGIAHFQNDIRAKKGAGISQRTQVRGYSYVGDALLDAMKDSKAAQNLLESLSLKTKEKLAKTYPSLRVSLIEFMYSMSCDATTETFEDWCSNFGYDTDSRKAYKTYETCRDTFSKLYSAGIDLEELNRICYGY